MFLIITIWFHYRSHQLNNVILLEGVGSEWVWSKLLKGDCGIAALSGAG